MSYLFRELVRVPTVSIHSPDGRRGSAVAEEMQELMYSFGVTNVETEKC
jgi:hypothetical protein